VLIMWRRSAAVGAARVQDAGRESPPAVNWASSTALETSHEHGAHAALEVSRDSNGHTVDLASGIRVRWTGSATGSEQRR